MSAIWGQFTSAYLFQIAQEKSCDYLLIIYMKKFGDGWLEGTHAYHAIREKLRHPGRALDLKTKDLIGHLWVSLIIDRSECLVCFLFLHLINSFLHCFRKKTAQLLTNQNGEIFSCILLVMVLMWSLKVEQNRWRRANALSFPNLSRW